MRRGVEAFALLAILSTVAVSQTAPQFEAADVHAAPAGAMESTGFLPNGRAEFHGVTLLRLITLAYSVPADRVVGGPSWLDTDRFDVVAKAASSASQAALRTMLKGLLAERFGLTIQNQEKPVPVLALVLAKRGAQKESSGQGDPTCKNGSEENVRTLSCQHTTLESLAERLPQVAPAYFNRPVVDRTGLKGAYDFQLRWVGRAQLGADGEGNSLSLFNSIEKQLGVKVENQTAPMPVLVVERANRTPAPNAAGVLEKLGPPPTEFEVADVRPSKPNEEQDFNMNAGRVDARAISLRELIAFAFEVEEDWLRGGEKWLDTDRYNILAKTAPTASVEVLRTMLQALLAERFGLKVHKEPQPVTVYALTVGKSRLKEADPSTRSTCRSSAADGARTYSCQNTTMAQLAEKLRNVAGGYLDHPVVDLTEMKGAYDFELSWAPRNRILGPGSRPAENPQAAASAIPTATDRPAGLTVFEAVDRQLGLKLASKKHTMPVVVIDHIDRTPKEN
jgi:uncharacterized protein (TIGR03435 family)